MKKHYIAPQLEVEVIAPDTAISSYSKCDVCTGNYEYDENRNASNDGYAAGMYTDGAYWFYCIVE